MSKWLGVAAELDNVATNCMVAYWSHRVPISLLVVHLSAESLNLRVVNWRNSKILFYKWTLQIPNQDPSVLSRVDIWPTSLTAITTRRSSVHILLLLSVNAKDARGPGNRERGGNWDQLFRNRSHPIKTVTSAVLWLLSSRDLVAVTRLLRTRSVSAAESESGGRRWSDNGCH